MAVSVGLGCERGVAVYAPPAAEGRGMFGEYRDIWYPILTFQGIGSSGFREPEEGYRGKVFITIVLTW